MGVNLVAASTDNLFVANPVGKLDISGNVAIMISAWVWHDTAAEGVVRMIVSKASSTGASLQYQLYKGTDGKLAWNATAAVGVTSTNTLPTGRWVHVVGVKSSGAIGIYVDGVLASPTPGDTSATQDTGQNFRAGARDDGLYWNGLMAEVAVWRGTGTSDFVAGDITRLAAGDSPLNLVHILPKLAAYFPMWNTTNPTLNLQPIDPLQPITGASLAAQPIANFVHPPVVPAWLH